MTKFESMRRLAQADADTLGESLAIIDISTTRRPVYKLAFVERVKRPDQLVAIVQPCAH